MARIANPSGDAATRMIATACSVLHAAADHLAFEHVESDKQSSRAVPLVVVRQGTSATLLYRQPGLGAIERLYLRLLVDREHDGVGRRVDVKADDFAQFWGRTPGPSTA